MIRKLLATTALATLVSTGAYAQSATAPADPAAPATQSSPAAPVVNADGFLASKLIGENVYNGTGEQAEKIGDVNDLVIAADGSVEAVVVGVGGFLGLGEKDVAVNYDEVEWGGREGDRWMVVATTKEQLEEQPSFDRSLYDAAPAPVASSDTDMNDGQTTAEAPLPAAPADSAQDAGETAEAPVTTDQSSSDTAAAPADTSDSSTETVTAPVDATGSSTETAAAPADDAQSETAAAPADTMQSSDQSTETAQAPEAQSTDTTTTAAIDKSTLTEMPMDGIRAEDLIGTTVYGANDENIGEIGDVVLSDDGKIDAYIVDVGGFLGMGEKEVAVGSDNLVFMTDNDGNKYLYTTFTKEQLDAAPNYDESSWAEKRDEQRLIVTR